MNCLLWRILLELAFGFRAAVDPRDPCSLPGHGKSLQRTRGQLFWQHLLAGLRTSVSLENRLRTAVVASSLRCFPSPKLTTVPVSKRFTLMLSSHRSAVCGA